MLNKGFPGDKGTIKRAIFQIYLRKSERKYLRAKLKGTIKRVIFQIKPYLSLQIYKKAVSLHQKHNPGL